MSFRQRKGERRFLASSISSEICLRPAICLCRRIWLLLSEVTRSRSRLSPPRPLLRSWCWHSPAAKPKTSTCKLRPSSRLKRSARSDVDIHAVGFAAVGDAAHGARHDLGRRHAVVDQKLAYGERAPERDALGFGSLVAGRAAEGL